MDKKRLQELAGIEQLDENLQVLPRSEWDNLVKLKAKATAKLMQSRYPTIDAGHKDFHSKVSLAQKELDNMLWDEVGDHLTDSMEKRK